MIRLLRSATAEPSDRRALLTGASYFNPDPILPEIPRELDFKNALIFVVFVFYLYVSRKKNYKLCFEQNLSTLE